MGSAGQRETCMCSSRQTQVFNLVSQTFHGVSLASFRAPRMPKLQRNANCSRCFATLLSLGWVSKKNIKRIKKKYSKTMKKTQGNCTSNLGPGHEETKKRRNEETKKRGNEETRKPRNEETRKGRNEETKKRRKKKQGNEETRKRRHHI